MQCCSLFGTGASLFIHYLTTYVAEKALFLKDRNFDNNKSKTMQEIIHAPKIF